MTSPLQRQLSSGVLDRPKRTRIGGKNRRRVLRSLLKRDGSRCCFCGRKIDLNAEPDSKEHVSFEHVIPWSEGGTNAITNLKLAHRGCNSHHGGLRTRPGLESNV